MRYSLQRTTSTNNLTFFLIGKKVILLLEEKKGYKEFTVVNKNHNDKKK